MSHINKPSIYQACSYWLQSFWCDPSATPVLAANYRARQVNSLARQLPLASAATLFIVILANVISKGKIDYFVLQLWSILLIAIALGDIVVWVIVTKRKIENLGSYTLMFSVSFMLGAAGLLYAFMSVQLMGVLEYTDKLILIALIAAFISTGAWQFSVLPLAGTLWVFSLCLGIAIGLLVNYGDTYLSIASLLIVYLVYLTSAVLVTSRHFVFNLMTENAIEEQRKVVGLLLRDFENNASDWLWEIDSLGFLNHVSPRMESVIGMSASSLQSKPFLTILQQACPKGVIEAGIALQQFTTQLSNGQPFSQVRVATQAHDKVKWWSFTAQPLLDANGAFEGWRGVGSDITVAIDREREMIHLANVDSLTGLANRYRFGHTLNNCLSVDKALNEQLTLITLDLDNFKTVNDMLGHLAGDECLKEVSKRLKSITPVDSLLARLGGDEFAWIMPNGLTVSQSETFGHRVRQVLSLPWQHQEHSFYINASMGVASAPADGDSPIALQRASDMALYSAKARGRNTLCFFDTTLDEKAMHKLSMMNDLRQSVSNQEFSVYYQPQIRFSDQELIGFEALVRWNHPLHGAVSPVEFIPLMEESGLIIELGEWVLQQACFDALQWPKAIRLAVNVSSVQIERSDLVSSVQSILAATGLDANRLEIELTETSLINVEDTAINILNTLRQKGIRIALDDFGTGYSSLSYLQKFPIDKIKVDRSFVLAASVTSENQTQIRVAQSILQAILSLAHALDLDTVAEGIETEKMANIISDIGFAQAQGFLYGRPMNAKQALTFIQNLPQKSNQSSEVESSII